MMQRFPEHRASSCMGASFVRKLLEKAKKGTTTEPYFAADIVEGNLQTNMLTMAKLGLPAAFLEHHCKNLTDNIILEGPDGHKWPVMLGRSWNSKPCLLQGKSWDSKPCLLQGWGEFATDCNLAVNDQILLYLWEDSHFIVHVFDSNLEIKSKGGGTSAHIVRTTLPQVTDPIESFGFKTTTPNILSLPSTNNNSGVAKNVHKENHTTQASPSGEKLANQEPGVEEDDDRVADFNAKSGEMVECFQSAPPSDAEEDQALSMERARNLNRNITLDTLTHLRVHESYGSVLDPPRSALSVHDYLIKARAPSVQDTARSPVRKGKEPKFIEEIIPKKRARQAPTDRSQAVSASTSRTRQARGTRMSSRDDSDNPDTRATESAPPPWKRLSFRKYGGALGIAADAAFAADTAKAREAADKEGEAAVRAPARAPVPVPASDPVTPLQVEAPKQAFKRPQPRNVPRPRQLYYSKRRPVTLQELQAALEAGQRYAAASYNRTHVMQLRFSQVYCGKILVGTPDFARAMELPLQGKKQVILYDMTGRQWPAMWHGEHPKRTGLDRCGWTSFVLEHYLEEGDVCVFELPDPKVSNISVTVFPVVPVTPTLSGWRNHYSVDEPVEPVVVPVVVPAVVQPEADVGLVQATLGQSSGFEKEDSGMEGKGRRLSIDLNEQILRGGQEQ